MSGLAERQAPHRAGELHHCGLGLSIASMYINLNDKRHTVQELADAFGSTVGVSFRWKNPDFDFRNPDFLLRNPDFDFRNPDFDFRNPDFLLKNG